MNIMNNQLSGTEKCNVAKNSEMHPEQNPTMHPEQNPTMHPEQNPAMQSEQNPAMYPEQNPEMYPEQNSDTSKDTWCRIVDSLIKSFDHNADSVLDISKDIQAIQSLAPDDMYRTMIEAIYADAHLSLVEKNDQALRILQRRQEDQKHAAGIVTELQTKQAENFKTVSTGHSHWAALVFGGIVITVLTFTPGGRNFVKQGLRVLTKGAIVS